MEKKYYDIIVSLVKQNEKYAGCEPILDDIVQDVYDHSKVVLGSVTNEDVISAYLNKVVATSLITVPKKLNFNTRNKHRIISNVEAITNVSLPQKKEEIVEEEPLTLTELETSDFLNEPEELAFEPELLEEEPVVTEVVEDSFTEEIQEIEPEAPQEEELAEESIIEEEEEEEELTFEADEPESLSFDMQDEAPVEIEEIITESVAEPEETFELAVEETTENNDADDFFAIPEAEQDVDKTLVDKMINGVPSEIEELSPIEETESEPFELIEETEDEPVSLTEVEEVIEPVAVEEVPTFEVEETFELDIDNSEVLEEDTLEELEPVELEEVSALSDTESDYKVPTFECFSYEPEKPEFFEDEICADLQEFDSKHPEKKLLQVCKLKYEEKLSVSEIAEKLEFSEETVLDTLNDIIELVKD